MQVLNQYSEANWILNHIQQAIGGGDFLNSVSDAGAANVLSDFAVLYRSRSAAITTQKVLVDSGLPVQVVGEGSPYEQTQVQDIIRLLRASQTADPVKTKDFSSIQCQSLLQDLPETSVPYQLAETIVERFGFEKTAEIRQFLSVLVKFRTLEEALKYIDDIAQQGFYDPKADAITMLTIHAAKGLEFNRVFLIAAEEGILPHKKADPNEERRLLYVAATRAKQALDILHTKKRAAKPAEVSQFIANISDQVLPKISDPNLQADQRRAQKRAVKNAQGRLF